MRRHESSRSSLTSKQRRLALSPDGKQVFVAGELPAWTPDASRIVFVEQHGGEAIVAEIGIDTNAR